MTNMISAKEELLRVIKELSLKYKSLKVKGAFIVYDDEETHILPVQYNEEDWEKFLDNLDFTYDSSWGTMYIKGYVWFEDGTWLERGEYDGSEWWEYKKAPEIPEEMKKRFKKNTEF